MSSHAPGHNTQHGEGPTLIEEQSQFHHMLDMMDGSGEADVQKYVLLLQ
jgi:hypothetical protein